MSKRSAGQKLLFYDLEGQGARLQLMALAAKHRPSLGLSSALLCSALFCAGSQLTAAIAACMLDLMPDAKLSAEDEFRFVHHDLLRRGDLVGTTHHLLATGAARRFVCLRIGVGSHQSLGWAERPVVEGHPARTKSGELSIVPHSVRLAAPCLHQLPEPETFTNPVRPDLISSSL